MHPAPRPVPPQSSEASSPPAPTAASALLSTTRLMRNGLERNAPLVALALVLSGYLFGHVDDVDALLYGVMADNIVASGEPFHLRWTPTQLTSFHDHLPVPIWLLALSRSFLGVMGTRVLYTAFIVLTWWLVLRLARRHGLGREAWSGLWLIPATESFLATITAPRIEQPLLLLFMLSLWLADSASPVRTLLSALSAGLVLLLRMPMGLALMALVPALLAVQRLREGRSLGWRDAARALAFAVTVLLLPLAFHLADVLWGAGQAWPGYLKAQVFASLTGARADGRPSHLAPVLSLISRFWPGLPFLVLGGVLAVRQRVAREPFVAFLFLWAAVIIGGLSLGRRHIPHHSWPAWPTLILLAGIGLVWLRDRGGERLARWSRPAQGALFAGAGAFAVWAAVVHAPSRCDVLQASQRLRLQEYCPRVAVASRDANPNWWVGNKVVEHLGRDILFFGPTDGPEPGACPQLIAAPASIAPGEGWRLLQEGRDVRFYVLPPRG